MTGAKRATLFLFSVLMLMLVFSVAGFAAEKKEKKQAIPDEAFVDLEVLLAPSLKVDDMNASTRPAKIKLLLTRK